MTTDGHDPVAQTITVQPILPAEAVIVCGSNFLHSLAECERAVAHISITDAATAQEAADIQQRLTGAGRKLEEVRVKLKAPFIEKGREIDAAAKEPAGRIDAAKLGIARKLVAYQQAQAEVARKAEAERQKELARLEKLAQEERAKAAEVLRQAAEAAKKSSAPVIEIDFDDPPPEPVKTEVEKQIDAVKYAPAVVAAKPAGISYRVYLIIESIDVAKLPDRFVVRTANEKAIRAAFCSGWKDGDKLPECAGVAFKIDRSAVSTGRGDF